MQSNVVNLIPRTFTSTVKAMKTKLFFETFNINKDGPTRCYGTFVEIGASDGRAISNTLLFEKYLNWSGVLIEGNPERTHMHLT